MRTRPLLASLAAAAVTCLAASTALPVGASASGAASTPDDARAPLAQGLLSPLSLAVTGNGAVYVSQNFAGQLMLKPDGRPLKRVYGARRGTEVGALSVTPSTVTFAESTGNNEEGVLKALNRKTGKVRTLADVGAYEAEANPDGDTEYGFDLLPEGCAENLPEQFPASYTGVDETHPYATTTAGRRVLVADAGANTVFSVRNGTVSTLAVLPPVDLEITESFAADNDIPGCAVGQTYSFEAVPTDVETGPDGAVYVSTLPGGPEDGSLGAAASVLRIGANGEVETVADGLVSVTGFDVANNGDLFVAELFRGRISRFDADGGERETVRRVPLPGDVEVQGRTVYATANVLAGLQPGSEPGGRLISFRR